MRPPDNENGSRSTTSETRLNTQQGTKDKPQGSRSRSVRHVTGQTELPLRHPAAYVSLYAPHPGRRTWWFAYVCRACGYGHEGRLLHATDEESAEQAIKGVRRSRCGRLLWFAVARVYRGQESEVAA